MRLQNAVFCLLSIFLSFQAVALTKLGEKFDQNRWIRFSNINENQRDLLISADRKQWAVPVTLRVQNEKDGFYVTCSYRVVSEFQPNLNNPLEFRNAEVFLDDRMRLPFPADLDTCAQVKTAQALQAAEPYRNLTELQENLLIFNDEVFVRESSEALMSGQFMRRFQGSYRWKIGNFMSLDVDGAQVTVNIPRAERDLFNENLPKESFCDLKFQAPIEKISVRAAGQEATQGYYLWMNSKNLSADQVSCLKNRMTEKYLLERDGRIGFWIGLKHAQELMLFFKVTWLGYL